MEDIIDKKNAEELMAQVERWLRGQEQEVSLTLTLHKTGQPDTFAVGYDSAEAGLLIPMLATDPLLMDAALSVVLKRFAEMDDKTRAEALEEFSSLCGEIHSHMESLLPAGRDRITKATMPS